MTPNTALAATITGTLLTLAPIPPQAIRDAYRTITPGTPFEQDPELAADLATINRITAWLPRWQNAGQQVLDQNLNTLGHAEDRLLAAHGYPVPTHTERYAARMAKAAAVQAIHDAAEAVHPTAGCSTCRAWEDCPDADRALREAVHADWVTRWGASL